MYLISPAGSALKIAVILNRMSKQAAEIIDLRYSYNDPYLNRFLQPDSIIPNLYTPQSLNRYSYVNNSPINYADPTGHMRTENTGSRNGCYDPKYCNGGQPKPADELKQMRTSSGKGNNSGTSKTPNIPNLCQEPTDCLVPPQTPVAPGPVLIPSTPAPPWGTPTPFLYGPVNTVVAFAYSACSSTSPNQSGCSEIAGAGADAIIYAASEGQVPPGKFESNGKLLDFTQSVYSIFSQNPFPPLTQNGIIQGSAISIGVCTVACYPLLLGLFMW